MGQSQPRSAVRRPFAPDAEHLRRKENLTPYPALLTASFTFTPSMSCSSAYAPAFGVLFVPWRLFAYNREVVEIRQTEMFARWFNSLHDRQARKRIDDRISRLSEGNPGDARKVEDRLARLPGGDRPGTVSSCEFRFIPGRGADVSLIRPTTTRRRPSIRMPRVVDRMSRRDQA